MLVLSRHRDESIVITLEDGRRIDIQVVDILLGKVRLGVTADRSIIVHRDEIQALVDREEAG